MVFLCLHGHPWRKCALKAADAALKCLSCINAAITEEELIQAHTMIHPATVAQPGCRTGEEMLYLLLIFPAHRVRRRKNGFIHSYYLTSYPEIRERIRTFLGFLSISMKKLSQSFCCWLHFNLFIGFTVEPVGLYYGFSQTGTS
ncbi:hypothetical protein ILYODFUR_026898 [Ilyodon furcidens]|uniref:Uncharacterized protein n=1 Tax=Ilyodon furcidens TaxID=33524 RepID=A0ABV0TFB4_9TELE